MIAGWNQIGSKRGLKSVSDIHSGYNNLIYVAELLVCFVRSLIVRISIFLMFPHVILNGLLFLPSPFAFRLTASTELSFPKPPYTKPRCLDRAQITAGSPSWVQVFVFIHSIQQKLAPHSSRRTISARSRVIPNILTMDPSGDQSMGVFIFNHELGSLMLA